MKSTPGIINLIFHPQTKLTFYWFRHSTMSQAQYYMSKKLILLPHCSFRRLIQKVDLDPERKCPELIFLTHTPKSGSNLIADIFKLLPNTG